MTKIAIYELKITKNGKSFIGYSSNFLKRKAHIINDLKQNKFQNSKVQKDFNIHETTIFKILEIVYNKENLNSRITHYKILLSEKLYNVSKNDNGNLGMKITKNNPTTGSIITTYETIKEAALRNNVSQSAISQAIKKQTKVKGYLWRKYTNKKQMPVKESIIIQLTKDKEFVKEWKTLTEIKENTDYSIGNISQVCNGKRQTAYGFIWMYHVNYAKLVKHPELPF